MRGWRNGSRNGLKIRWSQGREGSNPSPRTNRGVAQLARAVDSYQTKHIYKEILWTQI